jgi:hypothetical protein
MKTNKKPVQLTPKMLRSLIEAEVKKGFGDMEDVEKREKDTEEVDADELGTDKTLDKHIDYVKALKVEEKRLTARLVRVQEAKKRAARYLVAKI